MSDERQNDKNLWNNIGKMVAVLLTIIYVVFITNNIWGYVPVDSFWMEIIRYGMYYGPLALVIVITFEAVADKSTLIRLS